MDNFTERMLERTQRRQELLASASVTKAIPEIIPIVSTTVETTKPAESDSSSMSPPLCHQRRARLAELASRVDQWLEEDQVLKPNEKTVPDKKPKPQVKLTQQQQLCHPKLPEFSKPPLQQESPNLAASTLTVAQRRALFEKNAGTEKLSNPTTTKCVSISTTNIYKTKTTPTVTTTISTVSKEKNNETVSKMVVTAPPSPIPTDSSTPPRKLKDTTRMTTRGIAPKHSRSPPINKTKTTPAVTTTASTVSNEENNETVSEMVLTTPPRPIPTNSFTPPSRRSFRSVKKTSGGFTPKRAVWTPPCIKNVLLKKQLNKDLEDDYIKIHAEDKKSPAMTTSSPLDTSVVSPAERIALSVGHVRFKSPSPSVSLYPDLSLIEEINDQNENQFTGGKRRSNDALNSSTASSESVPEDDRNNEILSAKRSRCEPHFDDKVHNVSTSQETITTESSLANPTAVKTSYDCGNSSIQSDLTTDSPLSLKSTSFTYYPNTDGCLSTNGNEKYVEKYSGSTNKQAFVSPCKKIDEPPLIHSVSVYRKKQQQLRSGGTPASKLNSNLGQVDSLFHQRQLLLEDDEDKINDEEDDEDYTLQELEAAAARAWHLERTVVPEQDRIIDQATQALNVCDVYRQRQRSGLRSEVSSKFSPEHVHAERLLLIAGLRRTDAVLEAQRLRLERTLLPDGIFGKNDGHLKIVGDGITLVIESLRVPLLSSVISSSSNKNKYSAIEGMENQTRWPGGYRYFVCTVRSAATAYRPPITAATRPADALEESVRRFSVDTHSSDDGINYGYVEFITKKHVNKSSGSKKCSTPSESEGAPIMVNGLNKDGWKVTVELYGLSPTATGELENHNNYNSKDHHDAHETKSVLDKLWSTVKTPSKDSKKHHGISGTTCIESPGGPSAVRNTVFRQLGYFIFSDGQVERQQFTLNKVHQSGGMTKGSGNETVRVRMRLLGEGEQYVFEDNKSASGHIRKLTLPQECKLTEGFLTLFDDHELRSNPVIERESQWHRHSDIGGGMSGGTTLWRRLWFRVETIDQPQQQLINDSSDVALKIQEQNKNRIQTIVLRYWMYPEHAEQQRKPLGTIDLSHCISPKSEEKMANKTTTQRPEPAAPAPPELCARRNTLRLLLYNSSVNYDDDHRAIKNGVDDPLLLSADTSDERLEWCNTVNAAVNAISEHRKWIKSAEQQEKEYEEQKYRQQDQQRNGLWPATSFGSGKSLGKKKKLYK